MNPLADRDTLLAYLFELLRGELCDADYLLVEDLAAKDLKALTHAINEAVSPHPLPIGKFEIVSRVRRALKQRAKN